MSKAKQDSLGLSEEDQESNVEEYKFEPIKGYPMLNWRGKRPYTSTRYFPAQLKEAHGPDIEGWRNKIYWGDNLQVMSHLLKEYRGQVDLVYIDPPFDSKADYKKKISLHDNRITNELNSFEEKQYTDIWTNDAYLQFMFERLILLRELLSDKGSLWLHCDWRKVHHLRLVLDEVFGLSNFQACVTWRTMTSSGYKGKSSLGRSHADILYYSKSNENTYNPTYTPMSEGMLARYSHIDPDGRKFKDSYLGDVTPETLEELGKQNLVFWTSTGTPRIKHYLDEAKGLLVDDVWNDINPTNSQSDEQTGYPTQKPTKLLERIIKISSAPGDIVFDCFMGSGTTQAAAMKLGRRFIGADINLGAVQVTTKRLLGEAEELTKGNNQTELFEKEEDKPETLYTGFEVYNVNHYDVFRNPLEARELLLEAFEVSPLPQGSLYDGEKDGRMIKIMPVNRIASRADLSALIAGFDYKSFEKRQTEKANEAVEKITLICMGHEPDLAASLSKEAEPYKLDVDVVDILRDRQDLQFKRDAEALIDVEDGHLVIKRFYPMNLLGKLSLQKEKVDDWRELVESVMIDWNYDGAVLEPAEVDIPGKKELVKGRYAVPPEAGTIRVKITDLLSESLEVEVNHG
jgi:adenine-specific DNA-methyltransferase